MELLFLFGLICSVYSYFIYPLILLLVDRLSAKRFQPVITDLDRLPEVSLIITAYNEKSRIRSKLENSLEIIYPEGQLEIIVASDCSDDGTDDVVKEYSDKGVVLVRADEHLGKEYAQKCAVEKVSGEIIVFSDVATEIPPDAIRNLIRYYRDPLTGAISSEDRFISQEGHIVGEGMYVMYEMWLRNLESGNGGLVGLSGSFFSCRREVTELWDVHSPSDLNTAINCARLGLKAITAPDVLGYYKDLSDPGKEYKRKVRTVLRGMTGLGRHLDAMNPFKFGLFGYQMLSHKLMRWLVPVFLFTTLVLNLVIAGKNSVYMALLLLQIIFYVIGLAAHFMTITRKNALIRLIYFFLQVNIAIAHAGVLFITGKKMAVWQPSQR